jgi:hypothetical protein
MATPADIQAIGDSADTMFVWRIQNSITVDATYDAHYVVGISAPYAGRSRWCTTTSSETATQQASDIETALTA